jgi:glycerophosphoryl diester phosphodiesterase
VENTLAGFRHAISQGYDGIEMDVRLTKDGVLVLHHNAALNPKHTFAANGMLIPPHESPALESLTYAELREYTLRKPQSEQSDHIPTLADAVELISSLSTDLLLLMEIKTPVSFPDNRSWHRIVDAILDVLAKKPFRNPLGICSFNWNALVQIRRNRPEIPTWFITHPLDKKGPYWRTMMQLHGLQGMEAPNNSPLRREVAAAGICRRIKAMGGQYWHLHHSDFQRSTLEACQTAALRPAAWASGNLPPEERSRLESLGEGALCLDER